MYSAGLYRELYPNVLHCPHWSNIARVVVASAHPHLLLRAAAGWSRVARSSSVWLSQLDCYFAINSFINY